MKIFVSFCLLLILFTLYAFPFSLVHAQEAFNVASMYEIADKDTKDGDIVISNGQKGITRSDVTYDNRMFGVIDEHPLVVLQDEVSDPKKKPVIRTGDVRVNVNDFNGAIKKGDLVTTSLVLGKGMRAGQSGYVLGVALEDAVYSGASKLVNEKQVKDGTVPVAIRIEFAELTTSRNAVAFFENLNTAFLRNVQNPERLTLLIRYIFAGLIALLAFAIGFFTVARSISKSIESIGRNPLARNTIIASVIFQLLIAVVGGIVTIILIYIIVRI